MAIHDILDWPKVPGLTQGQIATLGRSGSPAQFWGMANAYFQGKCPFCNREHLVGEVLHEDEHWFLLKPPGTYNRHAAKLEEKLVLVLKSGPRNGHGSNLVLPAVAWAEFGRHIARMNIHHFNGGMLYIRFGSSLYNAGTVDEHPHWNFDVPNGNDDVRPSVYKDEAGWKKDLARFSEYFGEYEHGILLEDYLRRFK